MDFRHRMRQGDGNIVQKGEWTIFNAFPFHTTHSIFPFENSKLNRNTHFENGRKSKWFYSQHLIDRTRCVHACVCVGNAMCSVYMAMKRNNSRLYQSSIRPFAIYSKIVCLYILFTNAQTVFNLTFINKLMSRFFISAFVRNETFHHHPSLWCMARVWFCHLNMCVVIALRCVQRHTLK